MNYRPDRQKKRTLLIAALALFLLVLGFFAADRLLSPDEPSPAIDTGRPSTEAVLETEGKTYRENADLDVWLLMGIDKTQESAASFGGVNNQQNDWNLLFILDRARNTYRILPVNRDTMVKMDKLDIAGEAYDATVAQLALAHSYGNGGMRSCQNAVSAVSGLLYGITIDHYIAVTMEAIPIVNDAVGGVPVTFEEDLTPIDPGWVAGKTVTLQGDESLAFVRARRSVSDGTNLSRMKRQNAYILSLKDRLRDAVENDAEFSLRLLNDVSSYVTTDTSLNRVSDLVSALFESEYAGMTEIAGETRYNEAEEHTEFYPDEALLKKTVLELFF